MASCFKNPLGGQFLYFFCFFFPPVCDPVLPPYGTGPLSRGATPRWTRTRPNGSKYFQIQTARSSQRPRVQVMNWMQCVRRTIMVCFIWERLYGSVPTLVNLSCPPFCHLVWGQVIVLDCLLVTAWSSHCFWWFPIQPSGILCVLMPSPNCFTRAPLTL